MTEKEYWRQNLWHPDWYLRLKGYLEKEIFPIVNDKEIKKKRHVFYETVEEMLVAHEIPLANKGPNYDEERKQVDTIIIHHTSEEPDIRLSKLSAIGFVRQYGKDYSKNDVLGYNVKGKPIWSNHFKGGRMVFFAYHWLIRGDGRAERLLEDHQIGWQSGAWDINTRSIAISLSGDYSNSFPSEQQISTIKKVIRERYSHVEKDRIIGHREMNNKTTCPGNKFLGDEGWRNMILA